jgi:hypothetical protein
MHNIIMYNLQLIQLQYNSTALGHLKAVHTDALLF